MENVSIYYTLSQQFKAQPNTDAQKPTRDEQVIKFYSEQTVNAETFPNSQSSVGQSQWEKIVKAEFSVKGWLWFCFFKNLSIVYKHD